MLCQSCGCHLQFDNSPDDQYVDDAGESHPITVDAFLTHLDSDDDSNLEEREKIKQSFVLLNCPEAHPGPVSPTSNADVYNALEHIIEVASQITSRDLPLCAVCTANIYSEQNKKIQELEAEKEAFERVLQSLNATLKEAEESTSDNEPVCHSGSDCDESLERQEAELIERIRQLVKKKGLLRNDLESLEKESSDLKQQEEDFWKQYRQLSSATYRKQFEEAALSEMINHTEQELEQLKKCNVFDDAFHIYYEGHFATINGFRLGRLPSQPVDWSEINAALGQAVLLLDTISKRTKGFSFSKYELIPKGSFSKMGVKGDKNTYEMYGSSDLSLGKLWWYRRFDSAMIKFAACVKEYCEFAEKQSGSKIMQYKIEEDMINDVSLKLQFNAEDKWTKALKFLAVNLKYAVAWFAKQSNFE